MQSDVRRTAQQRRHLAAWRHIVRREAQTSRRRSLGARANDVRVARFVVNADGDARRRLGARLVEVGRRVRTFRNDVRLSQRSALAGRTCSRNRRVVALTGDRAAEREVLFLGDCHHLGGAVEERITLRHEVDRRGFPEAGLRAEVLEALFPLQ